MKPSKLILSILPEPMAICHLGKDAPIPDWAHAGSFLSITRTLDELSVVCPQILVPEGIRKDDEWRCLRVEGTLDFSLTGVISLLTTPLAFEGISVFVVSTYDTDYLMVKQRYLEKAIAVLSGNGHQVRNPQGY